jgi:hypothetical protein
LLSCRRREDEREPEGEENRLKFRLICDLAGVMVRMGGRRLGTTLSDVRGVVVDELAVGATGNEGDVGDMGVSALPSALWRVKGVRALTLTIFLARDHELASYQRWVRLG